MNRAQRRDFLIAAGAFLAAPFATEAQQPGKIARIGFLSLNMAGNPRGTESFRQGLRELGYRRGSQCRHRIPGCRAEVRAIPRTGGRTGCIERRRHCGPERSGLPGRQTSDQDHPHCLRRCRRSSSDRTRHQPCAAGRECHRAIQPRTGARRQARGAAEGGRSRGQSGRHPLAARKWHGRYRQKDAEGRRSCGAGAGRAASSRRGAATRRSPKGPTPT